jgi:hypothetical protein
MNLFVLMADSAEGSLTYDLVAPSSIHHSNTDY